MPIYTPPIEDFKFLLHDVLRISEITDLKSFEDLDEDTVNAIIEAAGEFTSEVLAPLNESGDREGSRLTQEGVVTPDGFADAYRQFSDGGWASLIARPEDGGQGLPHIFKNIIDEMLGAANLAFAMCPATSPGVYQILLHHGTDEMRDVYVPRIVSGEWTTAMSLTEPQCGSALGLIRTRAEPQNDGTYKITGTKMFNSWGDHDMAGNIVHLVLAKLPGAPDGTRGISLFLVPKFLPDDSGDAGTRNGFACGSLERKMGIHASATCVTNFDGATGYLVGKPNQGLPNMFVLMNTMRLTTGTMATGLADAAYRHALSYTKERIASRAASGAKYPDLAGDPIIVHPDVRRMLMTMRAFTEGARQFCLWIGLNLERAAVHDDPKIRQECDALVSLLTPVVKAFLSDKSFESIDMALQCYGGHGYIQDNGIEQYLRDERMLRLGEGTSGIQAMDLLHRKILLDDSRTLGQYLALIRDFAVQMPATGRLGSISQTLTHEVSRLENLTRELSQIWREDSESLGAASFDYLNMLGYLSLAFMWAQAAAAAERELEAGKIDKLYENKLATAEFYFARVLPEVFSLEAKIRSGASTLMRITDDAF